MNTLMSPRLLAVPLTACLTLTAMACATTTASAAQPGPAGAATAPPAALRLELPRPTGPDPVGRDILYLVDKSRKDPWVPASGPRRLMVSMYYPARSATGDPAPYMTPEEAKSFLQRKAPGTDLPAEIISGIRTHAHTGTRPKNGRHPLVVLSPGLGLPRASLTSLAEDLASRGYVVAAIDHAYESSGTTFPGIGLLTCAPLCDQPKPPEGGKATITKNRAKDISFVLNRLTGRHPAWKRANLINSKRIGMAGHSLGGDAASATMLTDTRVKAGINLDGTINATLPATGLRRPFLLMGSQSDHSPGKDHTWDNTWQALRGWKRWLTVAQAEHDSFTDLAILKSKAGTSSPDTIAAERGIALTRAHVASFFDQHLKGTKQPLLDAPTPDNPEVTFHNP
ncbi:alpha/beta hydrolase family protein [Streptosporangium roseum]|uniref:alpha/beta hydrolase family protein n=1 Tax=Streptosporangium roseum TaxID=2001 RepID=UPI0004CCC128|nr:acetylhydrolase [Streptosporangium roseum]